MKEGILRLAAGVTAMLLLLVPSTPWAGEAPPLMLATRWEKDADPTGWWMSEKYDGVRGYWDGSRMLTRQGEAIAIPQSLRDALPDFPLDGELWAGRGKFERAVAAVRDQVPGPDWSRIRYMVFDAPGDSGVFEARMAHVKSWLAAHPSNIIQQVVQRRCAGRAQLWAYLADVERGGGEGVMLRAPGSLHRPGRSRDLRKVKSFDDTEATVVGYNAGRGKYAGVIGSLQVQLADGMRFSIGSGLSDGERRRPPPIGSVVTFKFNGRTAQGKPRFPVFWRIRELPKADPSPRTPVAAPSPGTTTSGAGSGS